ncbi:MAG: HAD-IB family hydrolase, partial [Acidimicrobiales bacterium]
VANASVALLPQLAQAAIAGGEVADRTKDRLFEMVLAGIETPAFGEVSREFARAHLAGHLRVDVHRRLKLHRQRGDHTVIVSASPEVYIAEAARLLGAEQALATRLASRDGRLTGRYDGTNCRGEEKLRRLREWAGRLNEPPARLWVYGNSRGDLRMMRAADIGVNVGRLGRFGRLRDFPGLAATQVTD